MPDGQNSPVTDRLAVLSPVSGRFPNVIRFHPQHRSRLRCIPQAVHRIRRRETRSVYLTKADVDRIQAALTSWSAAYEAHLDAQKKARELSEAKDKARSEGEQVARSLTKKINAHPQVDNAMRAAVALPAQDKARTPIGAPTTRPLARLEAKPNSTLVVHFVDESTPQLKAKPRGVHACELRVFIGEQPPSDESGYTFLAYDTRTPYVHPHDLVDAGKTAYYMLRWLNAKLEPGPWGDVVRAKIPV